MTVNRASMKRKYILIPLLSGAVAFTACKEKPSTTAPATSGETPEQSGDVTPEPDPVKATATPEERAKKLGFAQNLPKDVEHFEAMYNGREAFEQVMGSELGQFLMERMADEGMDLEELMENDEFVAQIASYSEEYFAAYGKGSGKGFSTAALFLEKLVYYGARTGVFVGDAMVGEDGDFNPESPKVFTEGPLKGAPKDVIKMIAEFDMPAFYQGSKVSDEEIRELVVSQTEQGVSLLGMLGGAVEDVTITRGESEFTGYKVIGKNLSEMITEDAVEELQEVFDIADIESFKKTLVEKDLVVVSGVVGDYVLLFIGKSEDDLVLVDNVADSVCANEKMSYVDQYLDKDILTAGYSDASVLNSTGSLGKFTYRMIGSLVEGLNDGLASASSLGDTQDVEVLLKSLKEQGDKLSSLFSVTDAGFIAYLEDGLKMEVYGGSNIPSLDSTKANTLTPMGGGDGTFLFANWTNDKEYNKKVMDYIDTLGEASYLVTKRISALDVDDSDFNQFKQGFELFDGNFRKDVLGVWQALSGSMAEGLGAESAFVIDVNGTLPKVPGVPEAVLTEGKTPRITYVSTVDDRAKLQASWKQVNDSAENILKVASGMIGKDIPMQVPMSSEKNDLKTWFIPVPMQNDDFVPSVSVSDELFFASTSKTFSESLAETMKSDAGEKRHGAWLHVDFEVLNQYAAQWLKIVDANAEEILPSESAREDYASNKPMLEEALKAFGTLDELTLHTRSEGGRSRISMHLKTK